MPTDDTAAGRLQPRRAHAGRALGGSLARGSLIALVLAATLSAGGAEVRLIDAVKSGNIDAVRVLLKAPTASKEVGAAEPDGTTALHWAVRNDDREIVRMLLGAGAKPGSA